MRWNNKWNLQEMICVLLVLVMHQLSYAQTAYDYLVEAAAADGEEDSDKAITYLTKCIKLDPTGNCGYGVKPGEGHYILFGLDPASKVAGIAYAYRATIYEKKGLYDKALKDYNLAIEKNPKFALAYSFRGWLYFYKLKESAEKALSDYSKAIELSPNEASFYTDRAQIYYKLQKYTEAVSDFSKAIELDPKEAYRYQNRGWVYFDLQKYAEAISDFKSAIKLNESEKNADNYCGLAVSYFKSGDKGKAKEAYIKAITLEQRFLGKMDELIKEAYSYTKFQLDAINEMLKVMDFADYKQSVEFGQKAKEAQNNGNDEEAKEFFIKCIQLDTTGDCGLGVKGGQAYIERARIYEKQEKYDEAISDYTSALEIDPTGDNGSGDPGDTYSKRMFLYEKKGLTDYAMKDYFRYVQTASDYRDYLIDNPIRGEDDWEQKTLNYLTQGIKTDETGELGSGMKGWAYLVRGNKTGSKYIKDPKYNEAISDYTKAIEYEPTGDCGTGVKGLVHFKRAETYFIQALYEEAKDDYEAVVKINPQFPALSEAHLQLGIIDFHAARYESALQNLRQVVLLTKDKARGNEDTYEYDKILTKAYRHRGKVYVKQGKYKEALQEFTKEIDISNYMPHLSYFYRAKVYFELGNVQKALKDYKTFMEKKGGKEDGDRDMAEAYAGLALCYARLGDKKNAKKYFLDAIIRDQRYGNNVNALVQDGRCDGNLQVNTLKQLQSMFSVKSYLPPDVSWWKVYGGKESDWATSIQHTSDGGYIVAGGTRSYGKGDSNVYVVKLDALGNKTQEKVFGEESFDEEAWGVRQTKDGGYIVAGWVEDEFVQEENYSYYSGHVFVIKLNKDLEKEWEYKDKEAGGAYTVLQTPDGGFLLGGDLKGCCIKALNIGFGGGEPGSGYLLKLTPDGKKEWMQITQGRISSLSQTPDGKFIAVGSFMPTLPKDWDSPQCDYEPCNATYVVKVDEKGKSLLEYDGGANFGEEENKNPFSWEGGFGIAALSINRTQDGGFIVGGWEDGGHAKEEGHLANVYLLKLDKNGKPLWQKEIGGYMSELAYDVKETPDGGYLVAGWTDTYAEAYDPDTFTGGEGLKEAYLLKVDSKGNRVWQGSYGGKREDHAYSVTVTKDGGYAVAGYTYSFGSGKADMYILKLSPEQIIKKEPTVKKKQTTKKPLKKKK